MRSSSSVLALLAPFLVSAAPLRRTVSATDVLVLQFAEVLETFENSFYAQALEIFQESDFVSAGFSNAQIPIQQIEAIALDEATHVSFIQSTLESLGSSAISGCQFDFSEVLTDVSVMVSTARLVENLGVSAYLGAANMISDPVILTAAATIVTVESRHQTILNLLTGGTAIPSAFDLAFTPSQVLAIASQFISGCDIGISANPTLTITTQGTPQPGTSLSFSTSAITSSVDTSTLFCQMLVGGSPFSISLPYSQCVVPQGISGPVAIFITSDDQPINNNVVDENVNTIIAGPTLVFIDVEVDVLSEVILSESSVSESVSSQSSSVSVQSGVSIGVTGSSM